MRTYHDVLHLFGILELTFHTQRIGIATYIKRTARRIPVFGTDNRADSFYRKVVGIQFIGVAIYIDLTLGGTRNGHRTDTGHTRQGIRHVVIQYFVKSRLALLRLHGEQQDRNHVRTELEDDGSFDLIGQHGAHHVQFITHVVRQHVYVIPILKLQRNHGNILRRTGSDMLQVADRIQHIFQWTGHVILDVRGTGTLIGRHHHNGVGLDVRIKVYRQFRQREQTKYSHCQEAERGHNRFLNRSFV